MLLEKITNRLKGEVRIRVVSAFPERVMNLCGERKLSFWNVVWVSPTEYVCTMNRKDWAVLRRAADKLECTLTAERRVGVPFFLGRLRRRRTLAAALCVCAAALFLGSFFIWDFDIQGNTTVTDEEILRALSVNGVRQGTFGFSVDGEDLRNHILLEIPKLSWIAVNVSGCKAHVQVRERIKKPELADKRTPCNLVARRDGLVLKVEALDGQKLVLPGDTVTRSQILISGVEDTDTYGARLMAGMGKVYARTWYSLTARMPLTVRRKKATGKTARRISLIFGTKRINFCGNGSHFHTGYDKIMTRTQLRPLGIATPVTVEVETYTPFTAVTEQTTEEKAERQGEKILTDVLHTLLDEEGSVSSTLCSSKRNGDSLTVTLRAECVEQIGQQIPVYTDTDYPGQ
jgi:similar to stage IV sporulation protein